MNYGRVEEPDERDKQFPMRLGLPRIWPKIQRRRWSIGPILNQGRTDSCVGHAVKAFMMATPVRSFADQPPSAMDIYNQARRLDDDPTNDTRDTGTSVRAGIQAIQQSGHIKSYLWAQSLDDIVMWVLTRGTVVIGTSWYEAMDYPDPQGYISPDGRLVGGHCTLVYGVDRAISTFLVQNSWGAGWGQQGSYRIRYDVLDNLLRNGGEACTATERLVLPVSGGL